MNQNYIKFIEELNQFISKYNLLLQNYVSKHDLENLIIELKKLFPYII